MEVLRQQAEPASFAWAVQGYSSRTIEFEPQFGDKFPYISSRWHNKYTFMDKKKHIKKLEQYNSKEDNFS